LSAALEIADLCVNFTQRRERIDAVRQVSLSIAQGECVAIVGESGSGKTQLFMAAMGLLPSNARAEGSVVFQGVELLRAGRAALNRVRGSKLAMIFQDPMSSLTPHLQVGTQLAEVLVQHAGMSWHDARHAAAQMLERVRIGEEQRRMRQYPHELSGGLRQRVMIAMSLLCAPSLVIADEPTASLDVTVQAQIMELLRNMRGEFGMALALISHDLGLVAGFADKILVMYAGRIIESGAAGQLFAQPRHPYTAELIRCIPRVSGALPSRMATLPGQPPRPQESAPGCAFAPRCPRAAQRCLTERPVLLTRGAGAAACHFPLDS
jgi:oligopeptide transport system ATP-binding protein